MVRDRAGQFTGAFDAVLSGAGIEVVKIPPRSPMAKAYAKCLIAGPRHPRHPGRVHRALQPPSPSSVPGQELAAPGWRRHSRHYDLLIQAQLLINLE